MAWDDQGNGKSPWDPNKGQPPDLDQIVEEWQKRFNRLFGMKTSGSGKRRKKPPVLLIGLMILFIWYFQDCIKLMIRNVGLNFDSGNTAKQQCLV